MIGEWEEGQIPDYRARYLEARLLVMTIGPEGIKYLNEHAPEWRDHVHVNEFHCRQQIDEMTLVAARDPAIPARKLVADITMQIARKLVEGFEDFRVVEGPPDHAAPVQ